MEYGQISPLQIDARTDGVVVTIIVAGELDTVTATYLTRRLLKIGAGHPERVVLDLSGLVFVDVAGARALDETCKLLETECPVVLRQPRPSARKIFRLTGLMDA